MAETGFRIHHPMAPASVSIVADVSRAYSSYARAGNSDARRGTRGKPENSHGTHTNRQHNSSDPVRPSTHGLHRRSDWLHWPRADDRIAAARPSSVCPGAPRFLRPWYVLGPGRRWPLLLSPLYWVLRQLPATRAQALRLGWIPLPAVCAAIAYAIEHPPAGIAVMETETLRAYAAQPKD